MHSGGAGWVPSVGARRGGFGEHSAPGPTALHQPFTLLLGWDDECFSLVLFKLLYAEPPTNARSPSSQSDCS